MAEITAPAGTDLENWKNSVGNRFAIGANSYLEAMPDLATSLATAQGVGQLQSNATRGLYGFADSLSDRRTQFDGMEDQYSKTAFDTNSTANKNKVANEAIAGIASQFNSVRDQGNRQLERQGVNPASGKAMALNNQMAISQAAAQAGAANKARSDLDVLADSRQKTAIGFGSPLTGQALSAAQLGNSTGTSAINSAATPVSQRLSFAGGLSDIYGNAADGYKGLWQSQNLTAAQQANLNAAESASNASDNAALIGAAVKAFTPNDSGATAAGSIWDAVKSIF